ncbi:hypothetical protein BH10PSE5_BH10PSE5_12200 [soil metagenome]
MSMTIRLRTLALGAALAGALTTAAAAHDVWLQPASFWTAPLSTVVTSIQVGHGQFRERWVSIPRVISFYSLGPNGRVDRMKELRASSADADHPLNFAAPGTQILVMQSNHAQSELPGLRFNAYIKDEGMTPALELRGRTRSNDQPGREIYSRRAKALVQVGPPSAKPQPHVTRPIGLTLEIVPEINPYAPGAGETLPVRVIYEGRPLAGALVKLNNLDFDGRPVEQFRTDAAGRAVFHVPRTGSWQLNVIWTKPIKGDTKADFDTTFSSLTFGFPRGGGRSAGRD